MGLFDNGGLLGATNTPTVSTASGVWSIRQQARSQRDGKWPSVEILVLTSGAEIIRWDGQAPLVLDVSKSYTANASTAFSASVKMWGAGGACGFNFQQTISSTSNQGPGGGGGYSAATISFSPANSYILQVGEGGKRTQTIKSGATYLAGGVRQSSQGGAEGGGYTGIFKTSVSQANALLIAGGGGAGTSTDFGGPNGGAGGGSSGQNSPAPNQQGGQGGTQVAGGAPSGFNNATAGSALTGGLGQNNQASLGGGGGGYFGGGGGNVGGGGGGSGWVSSDPDVSSGSTSTGSGSNPANAADSDRGAAGSGGVSGSTSGSDGKIVLTLI
jgi:hypothetical protein